MNKMAHKLTVELVPPPSLSKFQTQVRATIPGATLGNRVDPTKGEEYWTMTVGSFTITQKLEWGRVYGNSFNLYYLRQTLLQEMIGAVQRVGVLCLRLGRLPDDEDLKGVLDRTHTTVSFAEAGVGFQRKVKL